MIGALSLTLSVSLSWMAASPHTISTPLRADEKPRIVHFSVEGEAEVTFKDENDAVARARSNARQKLYEGVLAALSPSMKIVADFSPAHVYLNDRYVHERFGPITKGFAERTRKVTLEADVDMTPIEHDMCDRVRSNDDPHVLIVTKYERMRPMIERGFRGACFTVVTGDPKVALEKVVNGATRFVVVAQGTPGVASAELIDKNEEKVLAHFEKKLTIGGANDAEFDEHVVTPLVHDMLRTIVKEWEKRHSLSSAARVNLLVKGAEKDKQSQGVINVVKKIFPDATVELRKPPSFDVVIDGGAEQLANGIEEKKVDGLTIEVIEVTRGRVIAALVGDAVVEEKKVQSVVDEYASGFFRGYGNWIEAAVHPDVTHRTLRGTGKDASLETRGALALMRSVHDERVPESLRRHTVKILDQRSDSASVRLEMPSHVEYLHLAKIGDKWKIVNVLRSSR